VIRVGRGHDIDDKGYKMVKSNKILGIDSALTTICGDLKVIVICYVVV